MARSNPSPRQRLREHLERALAEAAAVERPLIVALIAVTLEAISELPTYPVRAQSCHRGSDPAPLVQQPEFKTPNLIDRPAPSGILDGAITVTVKTAMAATGLGRTTIDKLMGNGTLERIKVGGRTLITVESVRGLLSDRGGRRPIGQENTSA